MDPRRQSDVILFCGPPHVGKTAYYHRKLADTHTRVSPVELSKANGDLSLRQLINDHVVAALRKGCRVVVDDENETRGRRASFIRVIKQKCPNARIECLSFHPSHEVAQLQWSQEFHNASGVERGTVVSVHSSDMIDRWEKWTDSPSDAEGILLTETRTNLRRNITPGLQVPALFMQWEAVVASTDNMADVKLTDGVKESLSLWYSHNPRGRIIVICDGMTTRGGDRNRRLTQSLTELARHMTDCPIYLIASDEVSVKGSFCLPPQPGILVFLIQLHHVDVESKATMYLYKSTSHMTMAANAGVPYVKASRVFQHPLLVKSDHAATKPPLPSLLRDIQTAEGTTAIFPPSVPLYEDGIAASDGVCHVRVGCWRSLYLGCKNKALLRRYNKLYQDVTSRRMISNTLSKSQANHNASVSSTNNVSPATRSRHLPSWMFMKSDKKTSTNKDSSLQRGAVMSPAHSMDSSTVYVMNEEELINAARRLLEQVDARGEGTLETPGVQCTNTVAAADKEIIAREGNAETTVAVAHDVTSRSDETKLDSDQEDNQTTAAIDDMFGLDLVHRRQPPTRLRSQRSDLEATDTGTVRPPSCDVTATSGHVSPGHGVIAASDNIVHASTVHRVAVNSVEIGQISPGVTISCDVSSSKTLQLQEETLILPSTIEYKTTSPRCVSVTGERGFRGSGRKGVDVRVASKRTVDTAGISRNSDIEWTEKAKRGRLSPDLSLLDDLF